MYNFYRRKYVQNLIMFMQFCLIDLSWGFFEPISVTQLTSEDQFYRNRNGTYFRQQKYKLKSILFLYTDHLDQHLSNIHKYPNINTTTV